MASKHLVGPLSDLPEEEGFCFEVGEHRIAMFRRGSTVYAVGDSCPHMGASLSEGFLNGDAVVCPWHSWMFNLEDGCSPFDEDVKLPVYRALVEDDQVFVEVETDGADAASCPAEERSPGS